jgi:hypothetical protein
MSSAIAVTPRFKFFDSSGNPAVGYKLYTYAAGTATPQTTWQDNALSSANANPITLDANGECVIWLDATLAYKFVLKTAGGATVETTDNISGAGNISSATSDTLTNKTILAATNNVEARSAPGQTPFSFRNVIINGDLRINQRAYVSSAVLASGSYGHDRWKAGSSGGDYTFTQLASSTQITIASGKSLIQVVEDKNVAGTSYVLSWTGTAQARYGVNTATPSGSYASSPIVISGQSAGSTISVEFNTGTLSNVQLERGTLAAHVTPFENRPYGVELDLAQRYYQRIAMPFTGQIIGTSTGIYVVDFVTTMRTTPSLSAVANGSMTNSAGSGNSVISITPTMSGGDGCYCTNVTGAVGLTAGDASLWLNATIALSAEL